MDLLSPGLGASQRHLLDQLKRRGAATLAELERASGLARESVRDHLRSLAALGLVERSEVRRAGPGRPPLLFRLSARGESLFPRREGELLGELAAFLLAEGGEESLARFFAARAAARRGPLLARVAGLSGPERVREVARILDEEGFLAEVEELPGGEGRCRLRLCHCPLAELVRVSRLPCRAELALVAELLGEPAHREEFMPEGAPCCTYQVQGAA
ncbi:MAG: MarR family transcriptional regulator [Thermoanaerobaculia bacterium]|nr:MarR family transcriptional regulator [Thermoanaerobaculia bacterium]